MTGNRSCVCLIGCVFERGDLFGMRRRQKLKHGYFVSKMLNAV